MLFLLMVVLAASIFFIVLYLKYLRYGSSREYILNFFCFLQGKRTRWVRDPALAHRVLQSSTAKGTCIEQLISFRAFLPILSLESVDGEQWIRMKKNFLLFRSHLPPLQELATITSSITKQYLEEEDVIDSPRLVKIIFHSMLQWIFDIAPSPPSSAEPCSWGFVLAAALEWRKELAIKNTGDMTLKLKAVDWIKKLIQNSRYYDLFGEKWDEPEYWSLVLQPFFISPIINITDVAVMLGTEPFRTEFRVNHWTEQLLVSAINLSHPFPVLERWFPDGLPEHSDSELSTPTHYIIQPNTHVFLPMDEIGRMLTQPQGQGGMEGHGMTHHSTWAAFGAGKRACAGRDIAFTLCSQIFEQLLPSSKFKPEEGHLYSGRDNDFKENWSESFFQIKLLLKIVWKLVNKRLKITEREDLHIPSSSYSKVAS